MTVADGTVDVKAGLIAADQPVTIEQVRGAGFTMLGRPARNAGASFSRKPHTGKLNALICTATPGREV